MWAWHSFSDLSSHTYDSDSTKLDNGEGSKRKERCFMPFPKTFLLGFSNPKK